MRALDRGLNYWNWCGHLDGMREAVRQLGARREQVIVAVQLEARTGPAAAEEMDRILGELRTSYLDIVTLYYVEHEPDWSEICAPDGALGHLQQAKRGGQLRMIGLTTHQRKLGAAWAETGLLDMLMIRYNAAHRGAERDVFPITTRLGVPVVTFTGLRWRALLEPTPDDPDDDPPPTAAECYRFCLANPNVSIALAAPSNTAELDHMLTLLDDWRAPFDNEMQSIRAHGDRVRKHAGLFW